jgi:HK97 family phage major capsid protein
MSLEELKAKIDQFGAAITAAQTMATETKGKVDALSADKIAKATEDATKAMEGIKDIEAKAKAQEKEYKERIEALELALAKGGSGSQSNLVVNEAQYKDALNAYLRKGTIIPTEAVAAVCENICRKSLHGVEASKHEYVKKDLMEGSNPEGGYFTTTDRSNIILQRNFETSPMRPLATTITTQRNEVEFLLDDDEAETGWVGETTEPDDTASSTVGLVKIAVGEIYAQPKATQNMLDDAGFDIEAWHAMKVMQVFARRENTAFITGTGLRPRGILTYDNWTTAGVYQRNAVEQVASGSASTITADGLIKLQNSLHEFYQPNASWGMHRTTFGIACTLKDSMGRYLINPMIFKEGTDKVLLGHDVTFMSDMPVCASDALSVVYADFQQFYTIVDRYGIRVIRDNVTKKPYIKFYTTKRVGGGVVRFDAGKILKCAVSL